MIMVIIREREWMPFSLGGWANGHLIDRATISLPVSMLSPLDGHYDCDLCALSVYIDAHIAQQGQALLLTSIDGGVHWTIHLFQFDWCTHTANRPTDHHHHQQLKIIPSLCEPTALHELSTKKNRKTTTLEKGRA